MEQFAEEKRPETEQPEEIRSLLQQARPVAPKRVSRLTTVLAVLFLAGVAYGAVLAADLDAETLKSMDSLTRGFLLGRAGESFGWIVLRSLGAGLMLLLGMFLCGFSAVGQPFSIAILLFRGIGLGLSLGYFYGNLEGQGILSAAGMLLPSGALAGYALILGCREALRMSGTFFRVMTSGAAMSRRTFRVYGFKFLILTGMEIGAALLDGGCAKVFADAAIRSS